MAQQSARVRLKPEAEPQRVRAVTMVAVEGEQQNSERNSREEEPLCTGKSRKIGARLICD
jgi:hypothetical protein